MLTPLAQEWPARYFDGASAARYDVTVRLGPQAIEIERHGFESLVWPYDEVTAPDDAFSSDIVRLERKRETTEMLIVRDGRFREALIQSAPSEWVARSRRNARHTWERTALAALAVLALAVVIYLWGTRAIGGLMASILPVSWEERMGDAFAQTLAPLDQRCNDAKMQAAVDSIVERLTGSLEDSVYNYKVAVGGFGVNAFAAPGGRIVVTPGLMAMTTRPEELAGVLAHEIQHVEQQHSTRAMFREMSGTLILAALTGEFANGTMALQSAATLAQLSHFREDETAADREGMRLMQQARIDGYGMIEMFQKFQRVEGNLPSQLQYVSTHPMTANRIEALQRIHGAADYVPIELLSIEEWARVKTSCRTDTREEE